MKQFLPVKETKDNVKVLWSAGTAKQCHFTSLTVRMIINKANGPTLRIEVLAVVFALYWHTACVKEVEKRIKKI